jgi:quaternary ammonium compound-resistance protein SugE
VDDLARNGHQPGTTLPTKEGHDVNWFLLFIAGVFEIGWVYALKQSDNFANLKYAALAVLLLALSMACLSLSLRSIPVGTAYAIWTGIGAVGAASLGILTFGEPATALRIICIVLIVAGVVGLKLSSA